MSFLGPTVMLPENLTIRVESATEYVPLAEFLSVVENTLEILEDIEAAIDQHPRRRVRWHISSVSLNSPLTMTVFPEVEEEDSGLAKKTLEACTHGLRQVETDSDKRPQYFSDDALERAKRLVAPLNSGLRRITLFTPEDEPVSPTQRTAANVDALLPKEHVELGTIEGRLESISIHKERLFAIWEVFSDRRVECRFSEGQLEDARQALSHRVAVTGIIRYDRHGRPVSISRISRIRVLRSQSQLPQAAELEGIPVTEAVGDDL